MADEQKTPEQIAAEQAAIEQAAADKAASDKAAKEAAKPNPKRVAAKAIADRYNVKVVFENKKGEYFTNQSYALSSEGGKADQVTTWDFTEE